MSLDHLQGAAREAVSLAPAERIAFIQTDRWIGYTAASTILADLEDLLGHPRNLRMPCRMVVGDPDNGKTMLLRELAKRHSGSTSETGEERIPVLVFEVPPEPSESRLYSQILTALRVAHREDASAERLLPKVLDRIRGLDVGLLLADEFHGMLNGSSSNQRQFLAALKGLLNALRIPFVAAGTIDVVRALATDTQFVTRFEKRALPRWDFNQESRSLLLSFEKMLPLAKRSDLAGREVGLPILRAGGGTIGGIGKIVRQSAIMAIKEGEERITPKIVETVAMRVAGSRVSA